MTQRFEKDIPLAELIGALRRELVVAVGEGEGSDVRFALGPVELELQVRLARDAEAHAGIAFWVLSIGGKGERTDESVQRIKLTLTPVGPAGERDVIVRSHAIKKPS